MYWLQLIDGFQFKQQTSIHNDVGTKPHAEILSPECGIDTQLTLDWDAALRQRDDKGRFLDAPPHPRTQFPMNIKPPTNHGRRKLVRTLKHFAVSPWSI